MDPTGRACLSSSDLREAKSNHRLPHISAFLTTTRRLRGDNWRSQGLVSPSNHDAIGEASYLCFAIPISTIRGSLAMTLKIDRSFPQDLQSLVAAGNARLDASHAVERLCPRYLHSTGQLHKGGPKSGIFLQLIDSMTPDLKVPGKPFTFRTLAQAQAAGDIQALRAHEQQAIVLPLGKNPITTIQTLTESLASRASARRPTKRRTKSVRARKK